MPEHWPRRRLDGLRTLTGDTMGRATKITKQLAAVVGGVVGGVILAVAALIAIILVLVSVLRESDTEHATKSIKVLFRNDVKIDRCYEVTDSLVTTYSCRVRESGCTTSVLFAVTSDSGLTQASLRRPLPAAPSDSCDLSSVLK